MEKVFDLTALVKWFKEHNMQYEMLYELKVIEEHDYNWTMQCQGMTFTEMESLYYGVVDAWLVEPEDYVKLNDIGYAELLTRALGEL